MKRSDFKTDGEYAFACLLESRNLTFQYENPHLGCKRSPDFDLTFQDPNIITEVRDVDLNDQDEDVLEKLATNHTASWSVEQPYRRLRRIIHEKADQLKEYKDFPILVVLYKNLHNLTIDLSNRNIMESMYGDFVMAFGYDQNGNLTSQAQINRLNAALGQNRNTHISAIAVLEEFKPHDKLANDITKGLVEKIGKDILSEKGQAELTRLFQEKSKEHDIDFNLKVLRLRIIHNSFTDKPISPGFMMSKYDEHVFFDKTTNKAKILRNGVIEDL